MGTGIQVEGLTKSFGSQRIWEDTHNYATHEVGDHRDGARREDEAPTASIPTQRRH
jgi:hypothetical protein